MFYDRFCEMSNLTLKCQDTLWIQREFWQNIALNLWVKMNFHKIDKNVLLTLGTTVVN